MRRILKELESAGHVLLCLPAALASHHEHLGVDRAHDGVFASAASSPCAAILLTPRATGSTGNDDNAYGMSDLTIASNTIYRVTGGIEVWGGDDRSYRGTRPTVKMLVANNLLYDSKGKVNYFVSETRGAFLNVQDGFTKLQVRNNTAPDYDGTGPATMALTAAIGAMAFVNNILIINKGDAGGGDGGFGGGIRWNNGITGLSTTLCDGTTTASGSSAATKIGTCARGGNSPFYTFLNNAIIGGTAGDTAAYQPPYYPANNVWVGDTAAGIANLGFTNSATGDYSLAIGSPQAASGVGYNRDVLQQVSGITLNARARLLTTSGGTIAYLAPDALVSCSVDHGLDPSFAASSFTRNGDTPGGLRARNVGITGYSSGSLVWFRVNCAQPVVDSFTTK